MVKKGRSEEPGDLQRMRVLLENMGSRITTIAEGHSGLLRELRETRTSLEHRMDTGFADLHRGIGGVVRQLDAHERAHAG